MYVHDNKRNGNSLLHKCFPKQSSMHYITSINIITTLQTTISKMSSQIIHTILD